MSAVLSSDAAPSVSVVLPTFNRASTLPRAIRSILGQSYGDLELLVIDDGSTDNTAQVVQAIDDPRLRYVPLPSNQGASAARNEGLRLARGRFIAFQDSDDEWLSDKLERQVKAALDAGGATVAVFHMKVVYGRDEQRVYGSGRVCCVPRIASDMAPEDFIKATHRANLISPQTLLFSRDLLDRVGYFDPLLVNSVDWDFSLRLVRHARVIFVAEPLVMTYIQDDSISTFRRSAARSQLRIALKLRKQTDVEPQVLSDHFARIGTAVSRFGKPRSARRILQAAVGLAPNRWRHWVRLCHNEILALKPGRSQLSARPAQPGVGAPKAQSSVA